MEKVKLINTAIRYLREEEYLEAIEYFKKLLADYYLTDGEKSAFNYGIALSLYSFNYGKNKNSTFDSDIEFYFDKAISLSPSNKRFKLGKGIFLLEKDRLSELKILIEQNNFYVNEVMLHLILNEKYDSFKDDFFSFFSNPKNFKERYYQIIAQENVNQKKLNIVMKVYLLSLEIKALLSVQHIREDEVAHYTSKASCENMLFDPSFLRLTAISNANDPSEGDILFQYLLPREIYNSDYDTDYLDKQAFISCFTFNHDCLNQFRKTVAKLNYLQLNS